MTRDHGRFGALGALLAMACATRQSAPPPASPASDVPVIAASEDDAPTASPPAPLPQYCEDFIGCAEERIRESDEFRSKVELSPEELEWLHALVAEEVESCRDTWEGLDPSRREWLESCTDCGGSCDAYTCLVEVRMIEPGAVFSCDIGLDTT